MLKSWRSTNYGRLLQVIFVIAWRVFDVFVRSIGFLFVKRKSIAGIVGESLTRACEDLGGAFIKVGQILSTRADLLPVDMIESLSRLRDDVQTLPLNRLQKFLFPLRESINGIPSLEIPSKPLASATIAQVYLGTVTNTGQRLAIKVRRPEIERLLKIDVRYIRLVGRVVAGLPWIRRFPITEATEEVCTALLQQIDFVVEARMLERFSKLFEEDMDVKVPRVDLPRCTDDIIVMDYLDGYKTIQSYREQPEVAKKAVRIGLKSLYKMIFNAGLVHCDLHAGNILCNDEGKVALLDFGFVSEMTPKAKQDFAEFFLSITFRDGITAARIVRETALRIGSRFDVTSFERDIQALIDKTAGRKAADFQVAGFVYELFQIQRRHSIYGSPAFTLPILSLLTYEGLIKDIYPEIDFQQEAVPIIMAALTQQS